MKLKHISTVVEFREPLGALRAGDSVKLSLSAEQEWADEDLGYEVALLLGGGPDGSWTEYIMEADCSGEDCENGERVIWSCHVTAPEQTGVYWYYFRIRKDDVLFFYGAARNRNAGEGEPIAGAPPCYQLTVYERDFETPEWFRNSTMYQIFPDRYCRGREENLVNGMNYHRSMGRSVHEHLNWEEIPYYQPLDGDEYYYPDDFFGGDLEGIRQNLDELAEMGISCLYLNPIVEADSNHRYNTADYKRVDPVLGTEEDFKQLCKEAEERGIRILLDGVYSHTGDDSIYFNKKGNYPEPGAFQKQNSPYDSWYDFDPDGQHYRSWWGFESLPEVNEFDPVWQDMVITGEDSVFHFWQERARRASVLMWLTSCRMK